MRWRSGVMAKLLLRSGQWVLRTARLSLRKKELRAGINGKTGEEAEIAASHRKD